MAWVALAFEIAKGLFSLITEAVGADAKKLEELGARFVELMRVGAEELAQARSDHATATGFTDERRQAALDRIKAARIMQAVTPPAPTPGDLP